MTTRTLGASATKRGRIELMHARRLLYDDRISKEIVLNDTDIAAATQATYFVQIFDRKYEQSRLREYQLTEIDSPIEYFFNFDHWMNAFRISEEAQPLLYGYLNSTYKERELGFPPTSRIDLIPLNLTYFLIRIDNLHDKFEFHTQNASYLNIKRIEGYIENKIFKGKTPSDVGIII
jgi:hypothetical protein